MKRLQQILSRNRHLYRHPLVFQAISVIEKTDNSNDDNKNKSDKDKKLESDLEGLRNHLLSLGKTGSRLNVLKEKKAALIGAGSLPNVTSTTEPLVQGADASELPDNQYSGLLEVLQVRS